MEAKSPQGEYRSAELLGALAALKFALDHNGDLDFQDIAFLQNALDSGPLFDYEESNFLHWSNR